MRKLKGVEDRGCCQKDRKAPQTAGMDRIQTCKRIRHCAVNLIQSNTLDKICKAFGITIAEFFEDDGLTSDKNVKKLLKVYTQMDVRQRQKLLIYAATLLARSE